MLGMAWGKLVKMMWLTPVSAAICAPNAVPLCRLSIMA